MQLRLLNSFVRLRRLAVAVEKISSVIIIPTEVLDHDSFECEVLDVGPGELKLNGEREFMGVSKGDIVVVYQGVGEDVLPDGSFVTDISALEARVHRA